MYFRKSVASVGGGKGQGVNIGKGRICTVLKVISLRATLYFPLILLVNF